MSVDMEAIKARVARATPGPWVLTEKRSNLNCQDEWTLSGADKVIVLDCTSVDYEGGGSPPQDNDAAFIVNAPTDINALVAEVESLRAALRVFAECPSGADVIGGRELAREALK